MDTTTAVCVHHIYTRFVFEICVTLNPGGDARDEVMKGHEGNTAVATAYICWRKHGQRGSKTEVPSDYYYLVRALCHARMFSDFLSTINIVDYTLNIIVLVHLWVGGEGPIIEWPYHGRESSEKRLSFRGHGISNI